MAIPEAHNPTPKAYHIGGIPVEFPYQPYGTQLAFMGRVIWTLDRAVREGHCHALLESPTGTGKSLSLLCSTLAWQCNYKSKNGQFGNFGKANPLALVDPIGCGGGFVPESQNLGNDGNGENAQSEGSSKKKKVAPTIYYASRTHSQISQVIREYRKTGYRVPMAVLASRKHYCTNPNVNMRENLDEECKLLLRDREGGCIHFKNAHKVKCHPSLQKGGCHEVHDIEDLVKVGKDVKGCSYYAARSMADDAQLVFCPYNYIVNPVIRGAMEVDIKGAVIVFDEAHNMEDIARDAGSVDIEEDVLYKLQMELQQLCPVDAMVYEPLHEMAQDILSWIGRKKNTLEKSDFQHHYSCWSGEKALRELQEANITDQCFPILLECATKAIKAATDTESENAHLSGMSVIVLEGLFSSLTYFFSRNGSHTSDYQLALQRYVRRDKKTAFGEWTHTFSLWCLNPAVVFKDIAELSLSVILTSGTLSPMNSFSSELGVQFSTCLEAPHIVDSESQVWAAVISSGPGNYPLNASYKTADKYVFQDALGKSLEEICKIVPAGSLVFFPSYKLMEKLCSRWRETGQWSKLGALKSPFVEPRGGSQEDFDSVLKGYYKSINQHANVGKKRGVRKAESVEKTRKDGAVFLAVCRGKVSEGIDFSDDNARVVIVVGIPFPNIHDIQVGLKKKYNDLYKTSKNLLSGNEWYCQQAFRALNQAAGRCIRHKFDYGAIILLDERYQEERNRIYISKWLRKSIQQYENFDKSMEGLKSFFKDVQEKFGKRMVNDLPVSDTNDEKTIPFKGQAKRSARKKNQISNSNHSVDRLISGTKCNTDSGELKCQRDADSQAPMQTDNSTCCRQIIDLESGFDVEPRCFDTSSHEEPEVTFVKETPGVVISRITSPGSLSKIGNSGSTIIQSSRNDTDQGSFYSMPFSKAQNSIVVTPEKEFTVNSCCLMPEVESSFNLSVESRNQKRRKSMFSPKTCPLQEESIDSDVQTLGGANLSRQLNGSIDLLRKIDFAFETNHSELKSRRCNDTLLHPRDDSVSGVSGNPVMDKRLQISCSLCKSPLGLPENHFYVWCSLTSSSKVHLVTLVKERSEHQPENTSTCIPVVMTDISSVNLHMSRGAVQDGSEKGFWCEEDGCVFKSVFCPFCSISNRLGVQILAVNASNVSLLNKILFYSDRLQIKNPEVSKNTTTSQRKDMTKNEKVLTPPNSSAIDKAAIFSAIDKFSYSPQQNSGGWRTTKPKMRLPKKG